MINLGSNLKNGKFFTLTLKFEESKRKIKISPNEENSGRDSIETSNNHRMYRLTKWPPRQESNPQPFGS